MTSRSGGAVDHPPYRGSTGGGVAGQPPAGLCRWRGLTAGCTRRQSAGAMESSPNLGAEFNPTCVKRLGAGPHTKPPDRRSMHAPSRGTSSRMPRCHSIAACSRAPWLDVAMRASGASVLFCDPVRNQIVARLNEILTTVGIRAAALRRKLRAKSESRCPESAGRTGRPGQPEVQGHQRLAESFGQRHVPRVVGGHGVS